MTEFKQNHDSFPAMSSKIFCELNCTNLNDFYSIALALEKVLETSVNISKKLLQNCHIFLILSF